MVKRFLLFSLIAALLLSSCTDGSDLLLEVQTQLAQLPTQIAGTLTPAPPPTTPPEWDCVPAATERQEAEVVKVIDGDTIDVEFEDGEIARIRYIGMDTPERGDDFYQAATEENASLLEGGHVTLVKDVSETDRYDRLLRYVFADGVFVNYALVLEGYASAVTFPPDVACAEVFREAEADARENQRGLWKP